MTQRNARLVSPLLILPFLSGLVTEGFAQDAGVTMAKGDPSLRASTCVTLRSIRPKVDTSQPGRVLSYGLTYEDLDRLRAAVPTIKRALPIREIPLLTRRGTRTLDGYVIGTTHEYAAFARLEIDRGRFLTAADNEKYENYAVIAAGTAQALFPEEDPIGQAVKCGTDYYTVVGVTKWSAVKPGDKDKDRPAVKASDMDIYIPLNTCRLRMGHRLFTDRGGVPAREEYQLSQIVVQIRDGSKPEDAAARIRSAIKPVHPKDDVDISIAEMARDRPLIPRKPPQARSK
jgi:putative ABC transport system permease protein